MTNTSNFSRFERDLLLRKVWQELDKTVTSEVADKIYDKPAVNGADCGVEARKEVIMDVISSSVNLERLYFVIRSAVMGGLTGLITFVIISLSGVTDFWFLVLIGVMMFLVSLVFSRFLDKPIVVLSGWIVNFLDDHPRAKGFVLNNF
jgi:hypothetical protein